MAKRNSGKRRQNIYLRTIILVHGKSEKIICEALRSTLSLPIEIISRDNGKHSIQVDGLYDFISSDRRLNTQKQFIKELEPETYKLKNKDMIHKSVKIFAIMDLDDCSADTAAKYKSKELLKDHWLKEHFIPIWNDPNLESTMEKAGVPFKNKGSARKSEYDDLFPSSKTFMTVDQLSSFIESIKRVPTTNLEVLLQHCLDQWKVYKG